MANPNTNNSYIVLIVVAIVAVVAMAYLIRPQEESSTALGRAVEEISEGMHDAANELDGNRTPGEKLGEAVEDVGRDIKDGSR